MTSPSPSLFVMMNVFLRMLNHVKRFAIREVGLAVVDVMNLWLLPAPSVSTTTTTAAAGAITRWAATISALITALVHDGITVSITSAYLMVTSV